MGRKTKRGRAKRGNARSGRPSKLAREELKYRRLFARAAGVDLSPGELSREVRVRPNLLGCVLMLRYVERTKYYRHISELLPDSATSAVAGLPAADWALTRLGAPWSVAPDLWGRPTWAEQLRWGLDKAADTARLLRSGASYGAVVLARAQLERWTINVAHSHQIVRGEDEPFSDFVSRCWGVYGEGLPVEDLGAAWSELSEWLHGRGALTAVGRERWLSGFDAATRAAMDNGDPINDTLRVHDEIGRVMAVALRQVRGCIWTLADAPAAAMYRPALRGVFATLEGFSPESDGFFDMLRPLDVKGTLGPGADELLELGRAYQGALGLPQVQQVLAAGGNRFLTEQAMIERRARAVRRAREGIIHENEVTSHGFQPAVLDTRVFRYVTIAEAALLVSSWLTGPQADALQTASSALSSAWLLWLEDTDDAMTCVRGVLEQTCRARAHRLKPVRAQRLEARPSPSPARWVEAAGWRRLAVLNRALGEFAHISPSVRWTGARDALTELQEGQDERDPLTARGHALDAGAYLLAYEVLAVLEEVAPDVAAAFRSDVTLISSAAHEARVASLLGRGLEIADIDFGPPDSQGAPAVASEHLTEIIEASMPLMRA